MHFTLVLSAVLAGLALSCAPPFNDFAFVGNDTHTTSELVEAYLNQQGMGWTEAVKGAPPGNPMTVWPRPDGSNKNRVTYCYTTQYSYDNLYDVVEKGLKMWKDKIGEPGADNGHSLEIVSPHFDDAQFCYEGPNGEWNKKFPKGSLEISASLSYGSPEATIGSAPNKKQAMWINPWGLTTDVAYIMAHEWGHVFGLLHEHQRADAEYYIDYKCENLVGYAELKRKVKSIGQDKVEDVCKSGVLCAKYNWIGNAWTAQFYSQGRNVNQLNGPVDLDLIM